MIVAPTEAPLTKSTHSDRYEEFCTLLRRARAESRLTQEEVAEALGVPQSWVSKCESGERRVDVVELEQFAAVYGKSITFFFPGGRR